MVTFKWVAPESIASALTTELNSLANAAYSNASAAIDNETDLYEYLSLELALASLTPTGSPYVSVYAVYSVDGTNYDDGGGATAPPAGTLLTTFDLSTGASTKRRTRTRLNIDPLKFKLIVLNGSGVSFAASANTLKYRRYNEQSVEAVPRNIQRGTFKPQPSSSLRVGSHFMRPANLQVLYLFDNGTAPVRDYTNKGHNATLVAAPTWSPDHGGALSFNGSTQYVTATGINIANKPFTISALIRPGVQGIENNIVSVGTGTGTDQLIHIFTRPSAQGTGFGMYSDDLNISVPLLDATVYRITCTLTAGLAQSCYVYNENGQLHDSGSRTAGAMFSGGQDMEMGRRGGGINDWFAHGAMFDLFIWDVALSAAEVAEFSIGPYVGLEVGSPYPSSRRYAVTTPPPTTVPLGMRVAATRYG